MNVIEFSNLERVLNEFGRQVAEKYRQKLQDAKKNATNALSDSVSTFVKKEGDAYKVYMYLQDYWKYIERGTGIQGPYKQQGKFPPVNKIEDWIKVKGIVPYRGSDGKIPTQKQLSYLIARKIWREGTAPFWFIRDSLTEVEADYTARIEEALRQDISDWIKSIVI